MSSKSPPPAEGGEAGGDDIPQGTPTLIPSTNPVLPNLDVDGANFQFEQQQTLITQLKEVLRKNEEQLSGKEKEVEEYASKLNVIKSRTRTPLRSPRNDPTGGETSSSSKDKKGLDGEKGTPSKSLTLLRQKVNESRVIFEKRDREMNESKRGVEVMVEQLKAKLDERDNTIRELQTNLDSSTSTVASELNLSIADDVPDLEQQLLLKENKILELTQQLLEQRSIAMGLQENLLEKDSVIDARTKAIALMSEDLCRKGKVTLDQLEETREEMRHMQNRFVVHETQLKKEKEALNAQLESKDKRLRSLEAANKSLETVKVELNAQVVDLEERLGAEQKKESQEDIEELKRSLSIMQAEVISCKYDKEEKEIQNTQLVERLRDLETANKSLEEVHEVLSAQMLELQGKLAKEKIEQQSSSSAGDSQKLSEVNKQVVKLKAQTKKQLKQISSLRKVSDANATILDLQNRIAELEDEKGNLQLHLVDFDELKVSEGVLMQRTVDLEAQVATLDALCKQQTADLTSSPTLDAAHYEKQLDELREELMEMKASKVRAELKAVELEEDVDTAIKEKNVLAEILSQQAQAANQQIDLENLKEFKEYGDATIEDLNMQLLQKTKMVEAIETQFSELLGNGSVDIWVKQIEGFKTELTTLQYTIDEIERKNGFKESEFEALQSELAQLNNKLQTANNELSNKELLFNDLNSNLKETDLALTHKDDELQESLAKQAQQLDKIKKLTANLKAKQLQTKNFNDKINELQLVIIDKDSLFIQMNSEKSERVQNMEFRLSNLTEINNQLQSTIEHEVQGYQNRLAESSKLNEFLELENIQNTASLKNLTEQLSVISEAKQQLETVQAKELQDAHNFISRLQVELSKNNDRLCDLEASYTEAANLLEEVNKQKDILVMFKNDVLVQIASYVEKITQQNATINELEKQCADSRTLPATLITYQERISQLESELAQSRSDLSLMETKLQEQVATANGLEERCADLEARSETLSVCQNKIAILERDLSQTRKALSFSEATVTEQYSTIGNLKSKSVSVDSYTEALSICKNDVSVLENDLSQAYKALSLSETRVVDQFAVIDDLKMKCMTVDSYSQALRQCQERVAFLESNLSQVHLALTNSEAKVVEQFECIDDLKAKCLTVGTYSDALMQTRDQIETLETCLSQAQSALASSEVKLQEQCAVTESLDEEIVKKNDRILRLETSLDENEEKRNALEVAHEDLLLQLQEASQSHAQLAEKDCQLEHQSFEINYLKEKLESLEECSLGYGKTIEENKSHILELENKRTSCKNSLKSAQDEIRRLSPFESQYLKAAEEVDSLNNKLSQTVLTYDQRNAKVVDELQKCTSNLENLYSQFGEVDTERRLLLDKCEKLVDEKLAIMTDLEESSSVLKENLIRIKELEEVICNLESDLHSRQAFANDCNSRINSLEALVEDEVRLKQELQEMNKTLHEDYDFKLSSTTKKNKQLENLLCSIDGFKDLCEKDVTNIIMLAQQRVEAIKQKNSESILTKEEAEVDLLASWTDEADDGGCVWGSEEAKLEEAHQINSRQKEQDLTKQVSSLELIIEKLEMDKVQLTNDLKAAQVQGGKLKKKLKSMNDMHDKSVKGFPTLDQTMENEFLFQISSLEKEITIFKSEKKALLFDNLHLKNAIEALEWQISGVTEDKDKLSKSVDSNRKILENKEKKIVELSLQIDSLLQNIAQFTQSNEGMPRANDTDTPDSAMTVVSLDPVVEIVDKETSEMLHTLPSQLEGQAQDFQEKEKEYQRDLQQLRYSYQDLSLAYEETQKKYEKTMSEFEAFKVQCIQQETSTKELPSLIASDLSNACDQLSEENRQAYELLKMKENEIELYKRNSIDAQQRNREGEALIENLQSLLSSKEEAGQLQYQELNELQQSLSKKTADVQRLLALLANEELKLSELNERFLAKEQDVLHLMARLEIKNVEVDDMSKELQEHTNVIQLLKSVQDDQLAFKNLDNSNNATDKVEARNIYVGEEAQSELDHALYLLHQKEVRCDELTLELMQLLEERDTLQIRLSTSLRMIEEMKLGSNSSTNAVDPLMNSSSSVPPVDQLQVQAGEASTEAAADVLADKLDQLRNVGRQQRQMALQHQRASGAIDANYTVSRDAQSQSETLYNWIWGRSTPKVMDI